jgi:hypothetical protein
MKAVTNHFKDPLNLILTIMVILSLLGAWLYGKQTPGLDYYVAWVAADAVKNDTPHNIYEPTTRYKLAFEYRNKVDSMPDAPRQKKMARSRQELPMTATPFLYWVTGLIAVGDYETDLDNWHALSIFILTISILAMCRLLGYSAATSLAFLLPVLVWFSPHLYEIHEGNVNSFQVGIIALILWLQSRGSDTRNLFMTGLVIGLLVMFKPNLAPISILFVGGWLVRRQFSKLGISLSGIATGAVAALLVSSWWLGSATAWLDWFEYIGQTVSYFGESGRSYARMTSITGGTSFWGQIGLAVLFSFLCLVFLWWGRRNRPGTTAQTDKEREIHENTLLVAMGCIVMLLASALVWRHYYLLTVPMFIVVFRPWGKSERTKTFPVLMLRVLPAIALVSMLDSPVIQLMGLEDKNYWAMAGMYSSLALFVIGLWQLGFRLKAPRAS